MSRNPSRPRPDSPRAPLIAALIALLALAGNPGRADDRDLLRTSTAKPYLFILLDTSASMNLKMGTGGWTPGGADSPGSRLFQAKQALYEVLKDVEDVQFGFAAFNQDDVHVTAKHWIYYTTDPMPPATPWDLDFPQPDVDGLTGCPDANNDGICDDDDQDGNPDTDSLVGDVDGDVLTFGPRFTTGVTNEGLAGTCASPLDLSVALDR